MHKIYTLPLLCFSLALTACSSQPLTELTQTVASSQKSESVSFTYRVGGAFRTQAVDSGELQFLRMSLIGDGISVPLRNNGDFIPVTGGTATLTIPEVPLQDGKLRVVTVQGFDANQNPLPAFVGKGYYLSRAQTAQINLIVDRRRLVTGLVLEDLLRNSPTRVSGLDLDALQALVDQATGFDANLQIFVKDPTHFTAGSIAALLTSGSLPTLQEVEATLANTRSFTPSISTHGGSAFSEEVTVEINDPDSTSATVNVGATSPASPSLSVSPGNWTLKVKKKSDNTVLATTSVNAESDIPLLGPTPLIVTLRPTLTTLTPANGTPTGGSNVTLTGTGFTGATAVKFGNSNAQSFSIISDTEISAVAPAGTLGNAVDVTVTTAGGSNATGTRYTYTPSSTITSLTNNGCASNVITINGTGFSTTRANNVVKFGTATAVVNSATATRLTVVVPSGIQGEQNVTVDVNGSPASGNHTFTYKFSGLRQYVDPSATGNGSGDSWANAFNSLSVALNNKQYCGAPEIWVKTGTYNPGPSLTDTFNLDERTLYGGFIGNETSLSQRNWVNNTTILSGDVNRDDNYSTIPAGQIEDNNLHVMTATTNARLDGFIVRGGNAITDPTLPRSYNGGGLLVQSGPSTVMIKNTVFEANHADSQGGGVGVFTSATSTYENVVFYRNSGGQNGGVAIVESSGSHTFNNVLIANNGTASSSRYMYTGGTNVYNHVTFANNLSGNSDGKTFFINGGSVTLNNSIVWGNSQAAGCNGIRMLQTASLNINHTLSEVQVADITCTNGGSLTTNNVTSGNPLFVNANNPKGPDGKFFTADDGYQLTQASFEALNNGDNSLVPSSLLLDITGINNRMINNTVDRGAYELNQVPLP